MFGSSIKSEISKNGMYFNIGSETDQNINIHKNNYPRTTTLYCMF